MVTCIAHSGSSAPSMPAAFPRRKRCASAAREDVMAGHFRRRFPLSPAAAERPDHNSRTRNGNSRISFTRFVVMGSARLRLERLERDRAQSHYRRRRHQSRPCGRSRGSARARPRSFSKSRRSLPSTCAAAVRAPARPPCSIRRRRWKASTPSRLPAARPSGSTPPPACRPGCKDQGRGFAVGTARVPIVPAAILFDLLSGGDKDWGRFPPYRDLGYSAAAAASRRFCARQRRRRHRRDHRQLQGRHRLGLGADRRGPCRRRARGGQCRRQRDHRRRPVVLGGAVRA